MFCPGCSSEERQPNQYCRACGTDLRAVRSALERPDEITASAVSAREEIGRAIAAKIGETQTTRELKQVAEDVLPQIEKFLEAPEEKRLRRIRSGVVTASVGLGASLLFALISLLVHTNALVIAGAGLALFLIGLGIVINGLLFTVPQKGVPDHSLEAGKQRALDQAVNFSEIQTAPIAQPSPDRLPLSSSSVTEHTTHLLPDNPQMPRG